MRFRRASTFRSAVAVALAIGAAAAAQDAGKTAPGPAAGEVEAAGTGELQPEARACLEGGLRWLADHQGKDDAVRGDRKEQQDVASTALAGLAWLANGSTQNRGPYASNIDRAVLYLASIKQPAPGRLDLWRFHDKERPMGRMHAHGYATLFLAELYGMTKGGAGTAKGEERARMLRDLLRPAVQLTILSRTRRGGYGYYFAGETEHDASNLDEASTTITQIQALRAAKNAGLKVPSDVIEDAINYVKLSMRGTKPAGSARYTLTGGEGSERTSFELTAAAVATLNASGVYASPELKSGLDYLKREMAKKENRLSASENYYFYGSFYAAQAMFQAGGDDWNAWFRDAQADLVSKAKRRGDRVYWEDPRSFGDAYATATACLILEIPLRYLPIFER